MLAAPTVFLYSVAFAVIRHYLPIGSGWIANMAAAVLALGLGWLAAQPRAMADGRAFAQMDLPEIRPDPPVKLEGDVRLERRRDPLKKRDAVVVCDALCAALLDTPGVTSVTLAATGTVFRLVARGEDRSRGVYPVKPEAILDELPEEPRPNNSGAFEQALAARKKEAQAVAAAWGLRLASRQKLVVSGERVPAAMTIRITEERRGREEISVSRVEILDREQKVRMRRSIVFGSALAAPLHFTGDGPLESFRVELARDRLSNGPTYPELKPVRELFRYSTLARPKIAQDATAALLSRLRTATANPALAPEDPDFGLAELWLPTIDWQNPLSSGEVDVLGRVIADERIALTARLYDGAERRVTPALREALGSRIRSASTPPLLRTSLARVLSRMPEGTFATLSESEKEILGDRERSADAYLLIVRMADQGEAAAPALLAMMKGVGALQPPGRRDYVVRAVALAFAILGPQARGSLAEAEALFEANRRMLGTSETRVWYLALARMGKPVDEFRWYSEKPEIVERSRESLRQQVQRFDPQDPWSDL